MYRSLIIAVALLSTALTTFAQTLVLGKPVSDVRGNVAFQIAEIIRVEGVWKPEITIGELLYPIRTQKAHPIMRFGEAVLIALTVPGDRSKWQGLHVHNGYIPALQGKPLKEIEATMVKEAEERDRLAAIAQKEAHDRGETTTGGLEINAQYGICPICKKRHIRIR